VKRLRPRRRTYKAAEAIQPLVIHGQLQRPRTVLAHRRLNQIAGSDRARLEGLTQFPLSLRHLCQQTLGKTGHLRSNMREGRLCAILIRTARTRLILNGEMSDWLMEHAWKAKSSSDTEPLRGTSTHTRSAS
jgi:hypothetical protein